MAISTSLPIALSDVCLEIYASSSTAGKSLTGLFAAATGTFNPTYEGSKDRLTNFRGYTHTAPVPATPTNLTATLFSGNTIVDWDDLGDAISWEVWRNLNGGSYGSRGFVFTNTFSERDPSFGDEACYYVVAHNTSGNSGNSNIDCVVGPF